MGIFNKLFSKNKEPEFNLEEAVGEYLLKLPQCSKDVLIISPSYAETHFTCEISVEAEDLLPWAEHHADAVQSFNPEEQAARIALPLWLRASNVSDNSVSHIPYYMQMVVEPYVQNFIQDGTVKFFCFECQSFISDIKMEKLDESRVVNNSYWTDFWTCPNGHILYQKEQEMHFHFSK